MLDLLSRNHQSKHQITTFENLGPELVRVLIQFISNIVHGRCPAVCLLHHVDEVTKLDRFIRGWESGFSWLRCHSSALSINTHGVLYRLPLQSVALHGRQCQQPTSL